MAATIRPPDLGLRSIDTNWNRERWERLEADGNRYEVIDGVLYVTGSPSNYHQWVNRRTFLALYHQLDVLDIATTFYAPLGVFMPGCDPVEPDLLVIRNEDLGMMRDKHVFGVPALLIEILLPSNPELDLTIKRAAYARAGVPEYWIMRPAQRDALVHSEPDTVGGLYLDVRHIAPDGELVSPTLPFRAPIASFFAGAPDTAI